MNLLYSAENIDLIIQQKKLPPEEIQKLELAKKAKLFAENELGLNKNNNYTEFVQLKSPYVTYVVSAAPKWKLDHYLWSFPIIGSAPYKGFFEEQDAIAESNSLMKKDMDTYVRGVSAYSTLGWFKDPVLSSMFKYKNYDLVNTIIHETVHATLYIKNSADFNERLASFIGNVGAELFYLHYEGPDSPTLKQVQLENEDEKLFSVFISSELDSLNQWYLDIEKNKTIKSESDRLQRLKSIQDRFNSEIKPGLKTNSLDYFQKINLNNARLNVYKTYVQNLKDFEEAYQRHGKNFKIFIERCKALEKSKDPSSDIKTI